MSEKDQSKINIHQLSREMQVFDSESWVESELVKHRSQELVDDVVTQLLPNQPFSFEEETVKNSLDELLLVLTALRDDQANGKALMEDLADVFNSRLSPGTVYPRLHELEEQDLLEVHELVRTKEYQISDRDASKMEIQEAMSQHIVLGYVLFLALEEF